MKNEPYPDINMDETIISDNEVEEELKELNIDLVPGFQCSKHNQLMHSYI